MTHVLLAAFVLCVGRGKTRYLLNHFRGQKDNILLEVIGRPALLSCLDRSDVIAHYSTLAAQLPLMMLLMVT